MADYLGICRFARRIPPSTAVSDGEGRVFRAPAEALNSKRVVGSMSQKAYLPLVLEKVTRS